MLRYLIILLFLNSLNSKSICETYDTLQSCLNDCSCSWCYYNLSGIILEKCVLFDTDNGGCGLDSIYKSNKYSNECQKDEILFRMIFFTFAGILFVAGILVIICVLGAFFSSIHRRCFLENSS